MQDKVISKIKVFGFALFAVMIMTGIFSVTTYAESLDTKLDTDGTIRVTVPTEIQCMMLSDGSVVVPTGFSIQNKEDTMSIMMEPVTVNDYGYSVDYTLDVGGTRVLTRTNQKDVAKPLSFEAGESKEMTLQVSQLTRAKHEKLMDAAAQGTTSMFRIQFSFTGKEKQVSTVDDEDDKISLINDKSDGHKVDSKDTVSQNMTESHMLVNTKPIQLQESIDMIEISIDETVFEESGTEPDATNQSEIILEDDIILEDEIILEENKEVDGHEETHEDVIILDPPVDVVFDTSNVGAGIKGCVDRSNDSESEFDGESNG